MMFLLVPMMALVMLILYWRPRRYYVEHLVFFMHNHAAIFLLLLIQALLSWIAAWLAWDTFGEWVLRSSVSIASGTCTAPCGSTTVKGAC